ncbi:chymotrypsin inhibitor-like [Xenopus laevis]|uniref:TIL domain-containing protein n=2 Tax=Xenopus laevis TaxID=8355 RepID=A0A974HD34_XENLA|nr:chymotrypsin inhibitor-like [Xenopus laevis]OCT73549.1 hypothetical protein XELAEV_18036528mg [Xenopus laevis]
MKTLAKIFLMTLAVGLMVMLMVEAQKNDDVKKPVKVCGRNEEYSTCMNNCPLTCANRHEQIACIQVCLKEGCQCKHGYLRNRRGICVLEKNCI